MKMEDNNRLFPDLRVQCDARVPSDCLGYVRKDGWIELLKIDEETETAEIVGLLPPRTIRR